MAHWIIALNVTTESQRDTHKKNIIETISVSASQMKWIKCIRLHGKKCEIFDRQIYAVAFPSSIQIKYFPLSAFTEIESAIDIEFWHLTVNFFFLSLIFFFAMMQVAIMCFRPLSNCCVVSARCSVCCMRNATAWSICARALNNKMLVKINICALHTRHIRCNEKWNYFVLSREKYTAWLALYFFHSIFCFTKISGFFCWCFLCMPFMKSTSKQMETTKTKKNGRKKCRVFFHERTNPIFY